MGLQEWLAQFTQVLHPLNLALMAFAEAIFLPIPPDVMLIPMVLLHSDRAVGLALLTAVASVAGAAVGYMIGLRGGRPLLQRFARGPAVGRVEALFQRYEIWAIVIAGFVPLPYKLFSLSAGVFSLNVWRFLGVSFLLRGTRFVTVALVTRRYGPELAEAIIRSSGWYTGAFLLVAVIGIVVWWRWTRAETDTSDVETDVNAERPKGPIGETTDGKHDLDANIDVE